MRHDWFRLVELVREGLGFSEGIAPLSEGEESVWKLAREHKVATILAPKILESGKAPSLEEEVRYVWQMAALREAYYTRQAEEWVERLGDEDVLAFPLKGVALSSKVYPLRGQRAFRDLDLLVSAENVEKTHEILLGEGFVEIHPHSPLQRAPRVLGSSVEAAKRGLDAISYEREDLFLEVHTRILPPSLGEYSLRRNFEGEIGKELDSVDFLAHLLIHTTRHHFLYGLRHLVDTALWVREIPCSLDTLEERIRESGLDYLASPAWVLAREIFPEALPEIEFEKNTWVEKYTASVSAHFPEIPHRAMELSGSPLPFFLMRRNRGESLWRSILGSSQKMEHQTGCKGLSIRNFFWRILRPIHLVWRHAPLIFHWIRFAALR